MRGFTATVYRPLWPMIVLRTPKGWTGPKEVDGHKVEGFWGPWRTFKSGCSGFWQPTRCPWAACTATPEHLRRLEEWMKSYKPEELFDENGSLVPRTEGAEPGWPPPPWAVTPMPMAGCCAGR